MLNVSTVGSGCVIFAQVSEMVRCYVQIVEEKYRTHRRKLNGLWENHPGLLVDLWMKRPVDI